MSEIAHHLYLYNPSGVLLTIVADGGFASLTYALRENEPGTLDLTLPNTFNIDLLAIDGIIEVYRQYQNSGMVLEGDTAFFIRKITIGKDANGVESIYVMALSALCLMQRRIVAYYSGSSYSEKISMPWDDMLKQVVRENYGALATDPERNLEPWLTVQADESAGDDHNRAMAWRNVAMVLQDIVNDVRATGEYASYDVVRIGPALFEFRVYIGPRGIDHSAGSALPVIVSTDRMNLLNPSVMYDWTAEKNYIYATGQGQQDERLVLTAADDDRIAISPFNRQEENRDARNVETSASVQAEADAALEEMRPLRIFNGEISQTPGCIYGVHWNWGDIVTAEYRTLSTDCYVTIVSVTIDGTGTEIVSGLLRSVNVI